MRIIAFGDIHEDTKNLKGIESLSEADYLIITGDLTNVGSTDQARKVLDDVRKCNKNIYAQAGNFDQPAVDTYLSELGINLHGRGILLAGELGIFGMGGSNLTPFKTPLEYEEDQLRDFLMRGFQHVKDAPVKILVSHAPPFDTQLDKIRGGVHVGSRAVRNFIEEYQPDICLTGHIHESAGLDKLGKTKIFNPGMLRDGGYVEISVHGLSLTSVLKKIK